MPQTWQHKSNLDNSSELESKTAKGVLVKRRQKLQDKNCSSSEMKALNIIFPPENYPSTEQGSLSHSMQRLLVRSKANGTLRSYSASINQWVKFTADKKLPTDPASVFGVSRYITEPADTNCSFSTLSAISPALTMLHETQNHDSVPAIKSPIVKLLLTGAKREAAERRGPVKKAPVLTQTQIHSVVDLLWSKGIGQVDKSLSLSTWRAAVKIYTMYKTLCRNDCFS